MFVDLIYMFSAQKLVHVTIVWQVKGIYQGTMTFRAYYIEGG